MANVYNVQWVDFVVINTDESVHNWGLLSNHVTRLASKVQNVYIIIIFDDSSICVMKVLAVSVHGTSGN